MSSSVEIEHLRAQLKARDSRIAQLERELFSLRVELDNYRRISHQAPPKQEDIFEDDDPLWMDLNATLPPLPEKEAPPPPIPTVAAPSSPVVKVTKTKRSRASSLPPAPIESVKHSNSSPLSPPVPPRSSFLISPPSSPQPTPATASASTDTTIVSVLSSGLLKKTRRGSDTASSSSPSSTPKLSHSSDKIKRSPRQGSRDKGSKSPRSPSHTPGSSPPLHAHSFMNPTSPLSSSNPARSHSDAAAHVSFASGSGSSPQLLMHHTPSSPHLSSSTSSKHRSSERRRKISKIPSVALSSEELEKVKLIQSWFRACNARRMVREKIQKKQSLLKFAIDEIYSTERTYMAALNLIINNFKKPMENIPDIVSSREINIIFSNIEELRQSHVAFLAALEQMQSSAPNDLLFQCRQLAAFFLAIAPDWRKYSTFCNNFWLATNCLNACKERKAFALWLKKAENITEMGKLGLADWLIRPVKKIPQYTLLLKQVQKALHKRTVEHQKIRTAKIMIKELAEWINERKKLTENAEKMNMIQASLYGRLPSLKQSGRVFVQETVVLERKLPSGRIFEKKLYLFNDVLLFSCLDGKFDKMIFLNAPGLIIRDPKRAESAVQIPSLSDSSTEKRLSFASTSGSFGGLSGSATILPQITLSPRSGGPPQPAGPDELVLSLDDRSWSIIFASPDEMNQWLYEIRHLVDNLTWMEINSPTKEFESAGSPKPRKPKLIESKVEKEGWLMKSSGIKPFRKRYLVLELGYLFYFKSKPSGEIQTSRDTRHVDLNPYFVRVNDKYSGKKRFCFELHNAKVKSYFFLAESKEERDEWIEAISPYTIFGRKKSSKDTLSIDMVIKPQRDLLEFSTSSEHKRRLEEQRQKEMAYQLEHQYVVEEGGEIPDGDDDEANLTLAALTDERFNWQEDSGELGGDRDLMSGSSASLSGLPGVRSSPPMPLRQYSQSSPISPTNEDRLSSEPALTREQIASAFGEPEPPAGQKKHKKKGSRESHSSPSVARTPSAVMILPTTAEAAATPAGPAAAESPAIRHRRKSSKDAKDKTVKSPSTPKIRRDSGGSSKVTTMLPPVVMRPVAETTESTSSDLAAFISPRYETAVQEIIPTLLPPPDSTHSRRGGINLRRSLSMNDSSEGDANNQYSNPSIGTLGSK